MMDNNMYITLHDLFKQLEKRMSTLEDQVAALTSTLNTVAVAVGNLSAPAAADLTPVLNAVAALQADVDAKFTALQADLDGQLAGIEAQFQPTPAAPAPVVAPTASSTAPATAST